jgi:uncharacterized protein YbjT (DUF2867 family)
MSNLTLVIGGTGKTGSRVAQRLQAQGIDVRIGSRSGNPRFDWEDPATWPGVFEGVDRAYIAYYPDLAQPGAAEAIGALARVAAERGVKRLVLLSGRGEPEAQRSEQALIAAGTEYTIVRCSWFSQNFSEAFMRDAVLAGELAVPARPVPEPFVDADDVAEVAVAALTQDGHAGEVYELTGPRALTFDEAAAEIAAATGRPLRFTRLDPDDFRAGMREAGVPDDEADLVSWLFDEVLDGRNTRPQDGVQRALGRGPRDFGEYARTAAANGAWA